MSWQEQGSGTWVPYPRRLLNFIIHQQLFSIWTCSVYSISFIHTHRDSTLYSATDDDNSCLLCHDSEFSLGEVQSKGYYLHPSLLREASVMLYLSLDFTKEFHVDFKKSCHREDITVDGGEKETTMRMS